MNEDIPAGAIPVEQFQAANPAEAQAPINTQSITNAPPGAIPVDQFEEEGELPNSLKKYGSTAELAKAGLENMASNATLGFSTGAERLFGAQPEDIQGRAAANEIVNPNLSKAEGLGGFLASSLIPIAGEANLVGAAGKGAVAAAGLSGAESLLGHVAAGATKMGVETALMQGGDEISKAFAGNPNDVQTALGNIGLSGLIGAGIGAPFGAISPLWNAAKGSDLAQSILGAKDSAMNGGMGGFTKKLLSSLGGVSEQDIDKYVSDREAINSTPDFRDIYDQYLPHVEQIHDAVATGKLNEADAKSALADVSNGFKSDLRQQGYEASVANTMAKQGLKTAMTDLAGGLQDTAIGKAPDIVNSLESLRKSIYDQSANSYDIANKSGAVVDLQPFYQKANESIEDLRGNGTLEGKSMADRLSDYIDNIKGQYGTENVVADKAKGLIQGLDSVSKYDFNATSFDKGLSRYYKGLRYTLDDALKTSVPEYRAAMAPLADDAKLLNSLGRYGDETSAAKKISSLKNPANYKVELPLLEKLEQRTGGNFTSDLKSYADKDIRQSMIKALPEYEEASKTADIVNSLKNPENVQALQDKIASTPEFQAHQKAISDLTSAISDKDALGGINPGNLETKLKAAMRGKYNVEKAIEGLPSMEGKPLAEVLDNLKTKQAFSGGHTNGSKNVNLFGGLLGGATGLLGGHIMGGIAGGAAAGAFMDKYGHDVVKKILDFYLDHEGSIPKLTGEGNSGAVRYALSRAMDHAGDISANSFKGVAHLAAAQLSGSRDVDKNSKNIFTKEPIKFKPIQKGDLIKLDEKVKSLGNDPEGVSKIGGSIGHYMPDHGNAIVSTASSAISYLNQNRPGDTQNNPLDMKIKPTASEQAIYNRKLQIAEQPAIALNHLKNGTLLPQDVDAIKSMYPALYEKYSSEISQNLIKHVQDNKPIPYAQRVSLNMFLGSGALDATMTPQGMQSILGSSGPATQMTMADKAHAGKKASGVELKQVDKMAKLYQTPLEARAVAKRS